MKLTLHLAKGTVSLAVHIALEELGVAYDLVWIDFATAQQKSPEYHTVNPKGRVPTLVTPQGPLTETAAILAYLAATHPEAGLMPSDPWQRAKVDELSLYLAATLHVSHAHKHRGHRWVDDPATWPLMTAKVTQNMAEGFALIEPNLSGNWVLGDHFSMADIYLYTVTRWLEGDGVPLTSFPNAARHLAAMEQRPAVQRTLAIYA